MDINTVRDWKFNIAFDNSAYKEIVHHSFLYDTKERDILDFQIEFYRKNFTFEQLLKSFRILKTKDEIDVFKSAVIKRRDNILYIPSELKQYYLDIINKDFKANSEFLKEMLNLACTKKCKKNPMLPIYKKMMGVYYAPVCKKLKKYARRKAIKPAVERASSGSNYITTAKRIVRDLSSDDLTQGIWGKFTLSNIDIDYNTDPGRGIFLSKYFYSGSANSYIIQTSGNSISSDDLRLSIYGNVYPGCGHLFSQIMYKRGFNFDCGADFIINGWGTFAAWHVKNNQYTRYQKVLYSTIANLLISGNWQDSLSKIYIYLLGHFSKEEAIRYLVMIVGYPGKFESYVMGALATEQLIARKFATSPMGLLDEYKKRNLADFFALFKPNTNKC